MINVDEIKQFIEFIANKAQAGSNPTPSKLNLALKRAQIQWINERYNDPNKIPPGGQSPARYGYQLNQKITDDLKFLIVPPKRYQVDAEGKLEYPSDYLHLSSVRHQYKKQLKNCDDIIVKEVDVKTLKDSEIGHILTSQMVQPTKRYPYCAFYDEYMQFFPKDIGSVMLTYLREPVQPVWAYTLVNNRPVYDPANSVDLEAPDEAMNEIAMRALSFLGIHIREPQLVQYAETLKQQGV